MIDIRPPYPGDLNAIAGQAAEAWVRESYLAGADFSVLFDRPRTRVFLAKDVPVAAGGFVDKGDGLAIGWTLIAKPPLSHLLALVRAFRDEIIATPFHVVEAHCFTTFPQSHRWVRCVGFQPIDGVYRAPDGRAFLRFEFRNDHNGD